MAAPHKAALAVIDMQEDFCEPSGALAVAGGRELAPIVNHLLAAYPFAVKLATRDHHPPNHISFASRHHGKSPFDTHTIPNPANPADTPFTTLLWPDHCVQDTRGCDLIPELDTSALTHPILSKGQDPRVESYSAFGPAYRDPPVAMTGLAQTLRRDGVTDLFVVGLALGFCVKYTAIDAVEHGFRTFVIIDATRNTDQSPEALDAVHQELRGRGVQVIGLDSEELRRVKEG